MNNSKSAAAVAGNAKPNKQRKGGWQSFEVTIVMPVHNEAENIATVCQEVIDELENAGHRPKLLLVDDGSTDDSLAKIRTVAQQRESVSYISFSRNFGKEAAIMAGMREAEPGYDVLVCMDSDGQHDPRDLLKMLDVAASSDAQIVCGTRVDRAYQTTKQRWLAQMFYRIFNSLSEQRIQEGIGDFNVLRPNVVAAISSLKEDHIFMKGMVSWVGFHRVLHPITIRNRAGGTATSSSLSMFKLAFGALLSFSAWPLRVWSVIGITFALLAFAYMAFIVLNTIITGREVPGYATTVILILGLGGIQLLSIGVLGEYIARIYEASKNRPMYIINTRG